MISTSSFFKPQSQAWACRGWTFSSWDLYRLASLYDFPWL